MGSPAQSEALDYSYPVGKEFATGRPYSAKSGPGLVDAGKYRVVKREKGMVKGVALRDGKET